MSKLNTPFPSAVGDPIDPSQLPDPDNGEVVVDLNPEPTEEETPVVVEPVEDPYKEKYENLQAQVDSMTQKLNSPAPAQPLTQPEPQQIDFPTLDLGDVYAEPEKVQENLQNYIKNLVPQIQEQAIEQFKNTPEFQAVTIGFHQDKYEREIETARQKYGERFTFDSDASPYMELLQQGKTVNEAHILLDHDRQETQRLDAQLKQQAEDEKRRIAGVPAGVPIRPNYNKDLVFKLSKNEQWAAAKGFPELSQADANKKYAASKQNLLNKGQ